jgi:hypothetical protein
MSENVIKDWVKLHKEESERIENISFQILKLSKAFRIVGNKKIAEDLLYYSETLDNAQRNMSDAVSESIDISYKRAQDRSHTIFKTALAGIELGKEHKEGDHEGF